MRVMVVMAVVVEATDEEIAKLRGEQADAIQELREEVDEEVQFIGVDVVVLEGGAITLAMGPLAELGVDTGELKR